MQIHVEHWGKRFSKIDTSADIQFFAQNKVKTKTKVITFADAQFWDMKILGGCCRIIGGDTSLYGFAPMVMKRFEIIENLYLSKALLKMAGVLFIQRFIYPKILIYRQGRIQGMHPPHPPPGSAPAGRSKSYVSCLW